MHYMKEGLQKEAEAIIVRNSITKHRGKKIIAVLQFS